MIDAYTETWREVQRLLNDIIENGRSRLEMNDQNYGESQFVRGRISACREVLSLVRPAVVATNVTSVLRPKDNSGI